MVAELHLQLESTFGIICALNAHAQVNPSSVPKFPLRHSGLELERAARFGAFYAVTGRRAAALGYEHRALEAWLYPLKILDDFQMSFSIEGYPLEFTGADTRAHQRPPRSDDLHLLLPAA